jgi:hypothetical protein
VGAGAIGLDDDVNHYLPFSVRSPYYPEVPITFRLLLRHDSALTEAAGIVSLDLFSFGMDSPIALSDFLASVFVPGGPITIRVHLQQLPTWHDVRIHESWLACSAIWSNGFRGYHSPNTVRSTSSSRWA